jgi:BirA family transcriptional regulator, biotin operon repressor / biotin---[acetyl-CoA-carboxylase] ligase
VSPATPDAFTPAVESSRAQTVARGTATIGCVVHALDTVDSTQAALGALAGRGAPEGTVVTARHQTGGRGQRGHHWWDAPGESLLLSILLRPSVAPAALPQLSLVAGLAVTDALRAAVSVLARLRWPNDVLVGGRKLGGILPEASGGTGGGIGQVILGIGINVSQVSFPPELADLATSIRLVTGRTVDRDGLQAAVLEAMNRRYRYWLGSGFDPMRGEWRERSVTIGQRITTADGGSGVAVDVAEDGALLVDAGSGALTRVVSATAIGSAEEKRDAARP